MDYLDRSVLFKKNENYTADGCPKRLLDYPEYSSIRYYDSLFNLAENSSEIVPIGYHAVIRCIEETQKSIEKICLKNGFWSENNKYLFCDRNRYWIAVITGACSAFLVIFLVLYFAISFFNRINSYDAFDGGSKRGSLDGIETRIDMNVGQPVTPEVSPLPVAVIAPISEDIEPDNTEIANP